MYLSDLPFIPHDAMYLSDLPFIPHDAMYLSDLPFIPHDAMYLSDLPFIPQRRDDKAADILASFYFDSSINFFSY